MAKKAATSCPRSLSQILIAALSTAAFIAAANFGFSPNISSKSGTWQRWFQCIKMQMGEPFRAFAHSLISAVELRHTLRSNVYTDDQAKDQGVEASSSSTTSTTSSTAAPPSICGRLRKYCEDLKKRAERIGLVAIMLNCPILIQIPPEFVEAEVKFADCKTPPPQKHQILQPEWMQNLKVRKDIRSWNPLELPPARRPPAGAAAHDHVVDVEAGSFQMISSSSCSDAPQQHAPLLFIKLHTSHTRKSDGSDERALLLKLNLVPQYQQLRYLRARSTFEAVVTTVQSLGYMLGVGQRIVMRLAVSPLEAIMAFFNLLIVLQFMLNLYACVHYQRPLLLRLSIEEFKRYADAHENEPYNSQRSSTSFISILTSRVLLGIGALIPVALYSVIQYAFIRYAISYIHHHCILCSLSAFLICLLGLSALILTGIVAFPSLRQLLKKLNDKLYVHYARRICTSIISTTSTILALVATILSWHKFETPTGSLLEWLDIPFVTTA